MRQAGNNRIPNVWVETADSFKFSCQIQSYTDRHTDRQRDRKIKSVWPVKLEAIIVNSASCFVQEHYVLSFYIDHVLFMALWKVSHYCGGTKARSAQSETLKYTYMLIEKGQTGSYTHTVTAWKQESRVEHTHNNKKRECFSSSAHLAATTVMLGNTVMLF